MFKTGLLLFLALTILVEAQPLNVTVRAKSAILYNPDNGAILFQKNATEPHYPASILKVATALFVLDHKKTDLNLLCSPSKSALEKMNAKVRQANVQLYPPHILEHDGTMMGIEEGKSYSIKTLLHGMLLISGNDAANVIAESCSSSVVAFMEELNQYLHSKGIHQTRFQNPHGLFHPGQMTTAYDMALITSLALKNPTFCQIVRAPSYEMEGKRKIFNTSPFIKEGKFKYSKYIGGKTGYTDSSGKTLVAAAENNGRRLIAVLLGCQAREDRFIDAIGLFETAFREKELTRILFAKDHERFTYEVPEVKKTLKVRLAQDVVISYYPSEECELRAKILWNALELPIKKGNEVGQLQVENDKGILLASAPVFAAQDLKKGLNLSWMWILSGCALLLFTFFKKRRKLGKR